MAYCRLWLIIRIKWHYCNTKKIVSFLLCTPERYRAIDQLCQACVQNIRTDFFFLIQTVDAVVLPLLCILELESSCDDRPFFFTEYLTFFMHESSRMSWAKTISVPCSEMRTPSVCQMIDSWSPLIHVKYSKNQWNPNIICSLKIVNIFLLVRLLSLVAICLPDLKTLRLAMMHNVTLIRTSRNIGPVNSRSLIHPLSTKQMYDENTGKSCSISALFKI